MNNFVTHTASTALLSGLFLITGCSSSGDGGSGPGAGVPANAITIADSITAETTTASAITTGTAFISAVGIEASTTITGRDVLNIVLDKMYSDARNTTEIATGVAFNEPCLVSGSVSGDETETSATINLNNCNDGGGITLNGGFSGTGSIDPSGPFNINLAGNLTVTFDANGSIGFGGFTNGSVGFNGFNYAANGNNSTGDYTVTTFTYAIAPSNGGGFAVEVTQPLVGNEFNFCQLTNGQVLVTGAAGSQARGTINANGTVKIEYHSGNGNFVESDNSPLGCLL